jgi:hypothetical protein
MTWGEERFSRIIIVRKDLPAKVWSVKIASDGPSSETSATFFYFCCSLLIRPFNDLGTVTQYMEFGQQNGAV